MKPLVGGFNPSEKYESQWETIITPLLAGWWFQPLWKIWKSVGKIIPIYIYIYMKWKIKVMFETTNQLDI